MGGQGYGEIQTECQVTVGRDLWGVNKRRDLLRSLDDQELHKPYVQIHPSRDNRYLFAPSSESGRYETWPKIVELCKIPPINGLMEKRGGSLIEIDRSKLEERIQKYFDQNLDWDTFVTVGTGLTKHAAGFEPRKARQKIISAEKYQPNHLIRYALRPFDTRWCYFSGTNPLWNRPRPTLFAQYEKGNEFLMSRSAGVASPEGFPIFYTTQLGDNDFLRGHAYYFPLKYYATMNGDSELFPRKQSGSRWEPNISPKALRYLEDLGITSVDDLSNILWMHTLAIGFSPKYLAENSDGIRRDWPRIPLPNSKEEIMKSAALGKELAALLNSENVIGVTSGLIRKELGIIAGVVKKDGKPVDLNAKDLDVTAEWSTFWPRSVPMKKSPTFHGLSFGIALN